MRLWRLIIVETCHNIIHSTAFEKISLIVIFANSIYLAFDNSNFENDSSTALLKTRIEDTFSSLYLMEFVLKVCAMGFILNKGSYLRDSWNIIDFLIIV